MFKLLPTLKQLHENLNCLFTKYLFDLLCALFLKLGMVADSGSIIKLKMLIAACIMNTDGDASYDSQIASQRVRLKSV